MIINRLVLASTSRFRLALLAQAGLDVTGMAPICDEDSLQAANPLALAQLRSDAKALSLGAFSEPVLVLGADQVLDFAGQAYGKARDAEEAEKRLQQFSGQIHRLHSAYSIALYQPGILSPRLLRCRVVTATLGMRDLSLAEIQRYVATGEWQGCAGCYQYENQGIQLFDWVDGDQTTIIGLPMLALLSDLRHLGLPAWVQSPGPWTLVNFLAAEMKTL